MHIWIMAESELLCARVATLLRNKYASILIVTHVVRIVKVFFFVVVPDICLALTTAPAKNIDFARAITLVRTS